jgi:hypothetical protein
MVRLTIEQQGRQRADLEGTALSVPRMSLRKDCLSAVRGSDSAPPSKLWLWEEQPGPSHNGHKKYDRRGRLPGGDILAFVTLVRGFCLLRGGRRARAGMVRLIRRRGVCSLV